MAASMVKAYGQLSLSKQLRDIIWREQNVNCILQIWGVSCIQYQCYHVTPYFSKAKKPQIVFTEDMLRDPKLLKNKKKSLPFVEVWNKMTVNELAYSVKRDVNDVLDLLHVLHKEGNYHANTVLPFGPFISKLVNGLGYKTKLVTKQVEKKEISCSDLLKRLPPDESQLVRRHPVVTIMGHVDHGKTTLLDALRHTAVAKSEFGGITQHIGAFDVTLESGERVTFLDTPGHAAFTSMRYRGAHVTDIVVLVVAADDGIKDQTLQSIEMAKNAKVPIIVAINKIDKTDANINNIQYELSNHGIVTEELGGEVQCVKISALKGINLKQLTEAIIVQAELMNIRGDPSGLVEAVIIECSNHVGRGKLVTALIQRGTLKKGCLLVSGIASAKVRAMFNDSGCHVFEAKPSEAVQIIGWRSLPNVGDEILEVQNDKILQEIIKYREKERDLALAKEHNIVAAKKEEEHLNEYKKILGIRRLFGKNKQAIKMAKEKLEESKPKTVINDSIPKVNVIIKGDVAGSIEALLDIFSTYSYDDLCRLNIVHYDIGAVTDSDLELAETFNAIIYGFNINAPKNIKDVADKKGVSVRFYNVVYKLIDDVKKEIYSVLPEIDVEEVLGEATVLKKFEINDGKHKVNVAGCRCIKGSLTKSEMYHVMRGNEKIYTGKLLSMKHLKEEVSSIELNLECGLRFEDPAILFQPEDTIVCFKVHRRQKTIDWDPGF